MSEQTPEGSAELTYLKEALPGNLQREVRLSPTGDTLGITPLSNGMIHGEWVTFHPNGLRKESVVYVNGIPNGPYRAYDTEGTLVFEGEFRSGRKHGDWVTWYDATQMRQQCRYENDVLSGRCTYWYIDGHLQREETYRDGKLIASQDH